MGKPPVAPEKYPNRYATFHVEDDHKPFNAKPVGAGAVVKAGAYRLGVKRYRLGVKRKSGAVQLGKFDYLCEF